VVAFICFGLTSAILDNPIYKSIVERTYEKFSSINLREVFKFGTSCPICLSFWLSLLLGLICKYGVIEVLMGWGIAVFLFRLISSLEDRLD
jgi:hypothetical protein